MNEHENTPRPPQYPTEPILDAVPADGPASNPAGPTPLGAAAQSQPTTASADAAAIEDAILRPPVAQPTAPLSPEAAAAASVAGFIPPIVAGSPRVRWAGIIWGLVLASAAVVGLTVTVVPSARDAAANWWLSVDAVSGTAYAFLTLGAIAVICAVIGLIGRAQRARSSRLIQG